MDKKLYVIIFTLLVLLTVFAGCTGVGSLHSSWGYTLEIRADSPVENATFIIPLPVLNGTPVLGDVVLKPEDFMKGNVTAEFTRNPPGLNLTGAENLSGYEPCFVVLHADMLVPKEGEYQSTVYGVTTGDWVDITDPNEFINTLHPVGNISLIVPKYNFDLPEPVIKETDESSAVYKRRYYNSQYVSHKIPVFADYHTGSSTELGIHMSLTSSNEWKEGYDAWISNGVSERFSKQFNGPQKGWFMTDISMSCYNGVFPNLEGPEWQKLLGNSTAD